MGIPEQYHMQKQLEEFKEMVKKMNDDTVVVKTLPMRPEWRPLREKLIASAKEHYDAVKAHEASERKMNHFKKRFWSQIEEDIGEFADMRYNRKTEEIEVLGHKPNENDEEFGGSVESKE